MEDKRAVVYFTIVDRGTGCHYITAPDSEPFLTWLHPQLRCPFNNKQYVEREGLAVGITFFGKGDEAYYNIAAPRAWVEKHCPQILLPENERFVDATYNWSDGDAPTSKLGGQYVYYAEGTIGTITTFEPDPDEIEDEDYDDDDDDGELLVPELRIDDFDLKL